MFKKMLKKKTHKEKETTKKKSFIKLIYTYRTNIIMGSTHF